MDQRVGHSPAFNPVAAARVNAAQSDTQYVMLLVRRPTFNCLDWAIVDLYVLQPRRAAAEEVEELKAVLHGATPVIADRAAGQAALDAKPGLLQAYLDLGRAKLRNTEDSAAREERQQAATSDSQ